MSTAQKLEAITDEGFFENIATAILREANPTYHPLVHTGVNVEGRTVRSPSDGICFVPNSNPPHKIVFHHTTTSKNDLKKKWLHNPSTLNPRNGSRHTAPAGDIIKTAEGVATERIHAPNLIATLVLTTNKEPDESLVRDVNAAGHAFGLEIDLWPCSRLSHFLDSPKGQWIRQKFLGIDQEELSPELLLDLSKKSLEIHFKSLLDNPAAWVPRALDDILTTSLHRDVTFLVAGSGLGKSVACYRNLATHIEGGGFGIILSHDIVASASNLEQAIITTLRRLHPHLSERGISALSVCSPEHPLMLVVEDINRSGQAHFLAEKLASWRHVSAKGEKTVPTKWRLICPLWPEVLGMLGDQARECIEPLILPAEGFTEIEGRKAVLARARLDGRELSSLRADEISRALGHDPLLIALHDLKTAPDPHQIISRFVEGSLSRAAGGERNHPASDYRQALRVLAVEMLSNRQIELSWNVISRWNGLQGNPLSLLGSLANRGELIRLVGSSDNQWLSFRHDRVRDWILADAVADMDRRDILANEILTEPYFAEVMGAVLVWGKPSPSFLRRVAEANPLALFHAFRLIGSKTENHADILQEINHWLDDPTTHDWSNLHLRWEALGMLAETDSLAVPALVRRFRDQTTSGQLARLRNGDLSGGIELCLNTGPGVTAPWRDKQIEHAKLRYGHFMSQSLGDFLKRIDLDSPTRIGGLRLAGHIADPSLAVAIETCWTADNNRGAHLRDYLWAFGECCGDAPVRFLEPVCDAWAALSDQSNKEGWPSPRDALAAYELRWAFHRWPPLAAIDYFIQRGSNDDLRRQITHILHGMDHPKAILFVVQELVKIRQRLEGTTSFSHFVISAPDDWQRAQENGRPMSQASRDLLLGLWQGEINDKHLRTQAFSLWAATQYRDDIHVLQDSNPSSELDDKILWERLIRGDKQAIPAMIEKLITDEHGYWWQCGRHLWSSELTEALDDFLTRRGVRAKCTSGESFESDWITHEMIMRLPENEAERLLIKHWAHLRFSHHFVQAALYVATPQLLSVVKVAIKECPEPAKLLEHLSSNFGIRTKDHPGLTREVQVHALAPFLDLLVPMDIHRIWDACNDHGWFTLRRELLDARLQAPFLRGRWGRDQAISELDRQLIGMPISIDHWIDQFLKADVSWTEILKTMMEWLYERRSLNSLQIVASAISCRGTRKDLDSLIIYEGMPEITTRQLIANTRFTVCRRSLH